MNQNVDLASRCVWHRPERYYHFCFIEYRIDFSDLGNQMCTSMHDIFHVDENAIDNSVSILLYHHYDIPASVSTRIHTRIPQNFVFPSVHLEIMPMSWWWFPIRFAHFQPFMKSNQDLTDTGSSRIGFTSKSSSENNVSLWTLCRMMNPEWI